MPARRSGNAGEGKPGTGNVKSAERVLQVFEYFEERRAPRSLTEIAQDLGYPASSTLALLRSLQALGYVTYDTASRSYFPSIRLALLGGWVRDHIFQDGSITLLMDHLSEVTEETIFLGVQNGLQAQYVHVVQTPSLLRYHPPVGTMRPLLRSAVGRVLLSRQTPAAIARTLNRINASGIDEGRSFNPPEVLADIERVRADGYAFTANQITPGAAVVAMGLPAGAGEGQPMAIGVGGPASRLEPALATVVAKIEAAIRTYVAAPESR